MGVLSPTILTCCCCCSGDNEEEEEEDDDLADDRMGLIWAISGASGLTMFWGLLFGIEGIEGVMTVDEVADDVVEDGGFDGDDD